MSSARKITLCLTKKERKVMLMAFEYLAGEPGDADHKTYESIRRKLLKIISHDETTPAPDEVGK